MKSPNFSCVDDVVHNDTLQAIAINFYKDFDGYVESMQNNRCVTYNLPVMWLVDRLGINLEYGSWGGIDYTMDELRVLIAVFNNLITNSAHSWEYFYFNSLDDPEDMGFVKDAVQVCIYGAYAVYNQYKAFQFREGLN